MYERMFVITCRCPGPQSGSLGLSLGKVSRSADVVAWCASSCAASSGAPAHRSHDQGQSMSLTRTTWVRCDRFRCTSQGLIKWGRILYINAVVLTRRGLSLLQHGVSQQEIIRGSREQKVKDLIFEIASEAHAEMETVGSVLVLKSCDVQFFSSCLCW